MYVMQRLNSLGISWRKTNLTLKNVGQYYPGKIKSFRGQDILLKDNNIEIPTNDVPSFMNEYFSMVDNKVNLDCLTSYKTILIHCT